MTMIVASSVRYMYCSSLRRPASSLPPISSAQTNIRISRGVSLSFVRSSSETPTPNRDSARCAPIPVATQSGGIVRSVSFCQWCGGRTKHEVPDGEEKLRVICSLCGKITYQNPKMGLD